MCIQSDLQYGKQLHAGEGTVATFTVANLHSTLNQIRQLLSVKDNKSMPMDASS